IFLTVNVTRRAQILCADPCRHHSTFCNRRLEPMRDCSSCQTWLQALVAILVLSTVTAVAQRHTYFRAPAPSVSETNDCLSPSKACTAFQRAVDLCPVAHYCTIVAVPGIYSQGINVTHYKHVLILGATDQRGACIDRHAITIEGKIENGHQRDPIFWAQDHATL